LTHRPPHNQRLVDYAFGMAWGVTRHFPEAVAERLLRGAADRVWKHGGSGVRQLEANLARAVPGITAPALRDLSQQAMRSYFRYWHEAFRLPSWSHRRIVDMVVTINESPLREVHAQGRGAIVALPHMGNWDLAGAWACLTGLPVSTVAERLRPESLYKRFVAYRAELGIEVEPLSGSGNPLTAMRSALERGRVVCLLADRSVGRGGVDVVLLDETARLPGGPATLARMCKVPVVVATSSYRGPLMHLQISDPIEPIAGAGGVTATTQRIADEFSAAIRRTPRDWHMLQRVFVSDPATEPAEVRDDAGTSAGGG
jgi:phosphatidylinositol dimannoside acyltransferase